MKIKISMDSACDLRPDVVEKYDIGVAPLTIVCEDTEYKDGVGFTPDDIFRTVEEGGVCTSSAINVAEYIELFGSYLQTHDAVIHINLSSEISACHQNALVAAANRPVYVIDSRSLSSGSGMLAHTAAELAAEGLAAEDIAERLRGLTDKIGTSFVINTLKYLHRGGRCSGVAALGANILKLKPCIEMENGKMGVGKKYRGQIIPVLHQYIKDRLEGREDIDYKRIYMTHTTGFTEAELSALHSAIRSYGPFEDIQDTYAGCTIANHSGPLTLGILYYKK